MSAIALKKPERMSLEISNSIFANNLGGISSSLSSSNDSAKINSNEGGLDVTFDSGMRKSIEKRGNVQ
jgi:hypothetical protein